MRIAWLSDIHLDFIADEALDAFGRTVGQTGADLVLVTGDIAVADSFDSKLQRLSAAARRPVDFVLGNHDFYGGSIAEVRGRAERAGEGLRYLPAAGPRLIGARTWLIGVDGWGDARLGVPETTRVVLNDFFAIEDLAAAGPKLLEKLRSLGDDEASTLREQLARIDDDAAKIVVATHVPPFAEACWHEGAISGDEWLPFFTCDAVGRVLREAAARRPTTELVVLCGHTHGEGRAEIAENLVVHTAAAEYGVPAVMSVIEP
jgi:3',5'-cyclic AMP phosphodiesterase CpdA